MFLTLEIFECLHYRIQSLFLTKLIEFLVERKERRIYFNVCVKETQTEKEAKGGGGGKMRKSKTQRQRQVLIFFGRKQKNEKFK